MWESPDEVCFDGLPDHFVVKSNCRDNGKYIAIVRDKANFDFAALEQEIKDDWFNPMNLLINGFCSAYHSIKPKVLVEEYIESDSEAPDDCKVFCFSGEPKFCYMVKDRFTNGIPDSYTNPLGFYTLDWNLLPVQCASHPIYENAPKPKHLREMIDIARTLSSEFPFVRVDFFSTEKLYLSEMTFYPFSGYEKYSPPEFDAYLGDLFEIG